MTINSNFKMRKFKAQYPRLKKPVAKKYARQDKRHTHNTIAGLEDLTAIILDISFTLRRLDTFINTIQSEVYAMQSRTDTALDTVNLTRLGPYAYPIDHCQKRNNHVLSTKAKD